MFFVSHNLFAKEHKGEVKIATFIEPPFVDVVKGQFVGENIEIAKLLAASVGLKPIFIRCPFARCLTMVKRGHADMIFGLRKLPEREKDLLFLNPPYFNQHYPLRFFTLSSKPLSINSFDDLKDLTVGILRGATYFDLFDEDNSIRKVELTTRKQLVDMLLRGRIDTFIEREESIVPLLPTEEYSQKLLLANYQYDKSVDSYIAISKYSAIKTYAQPLSTQLKNLVTNGTIKNIKMKSHD
ncbi:MAG: transporter substrate-binding domain-containing protein [Colwellia sp.]|nr:transporter substrate-binding domain-containing protein [Colwellia sp.]